jgi:hypothetical protein
MECTFAETPPPRSKPITAAVDDRGDGETFMSLATGNGTTIASQNNFTIRPALTTRVGIEEVHGVPGISSAPGGGLPLETLQETMALGNVYYTRCIPAEAIRDLLQRRRQT